MRWICTNVWGANNMNIHNDVTGLMTDRGRSHSGQLVWVVRVGRREGGGGCVIIAHMRDIKEFARSRRATLFRLR